MCGGAGVWCAGVACVQVCRHAMQGAKMCACKVKRARKEEREEGRRGGREEGGIHPSDSDPSIRLSSSFSGNVW